MIKALLLDDEQNAYEYLKTIIEKHLPQISAVFATSDVTEAQLFLNSEQPQLVFLDVEMPGTSGFDFLLSQKKKNFDVIFTTAYSKYAIQAIRFSAIDFLLKPVQPDELVASFNRFLNQPKELERRQKLYEHLFENLNTRNEKEFRLTLTKGNRLYFVSPADICYCKADNNYTQLFTKDRTDFVVSKTLKEFEEMFQEFGFIRIHKSTMINPNYVKEVESESILLSNGEKLEISRRRKEEVMRELSARR